jgi:formiminoglutamase
MAAQANSGTSFRLMAESCREYGWPFHYCCLGIAEPSNTVALPDRARELGVTWRTDTGLSGTKLTESVTALQYFLAGVDCAYLSICLDVLPASIAPGVSAPAARGVSLETVELLMETVKASGKLIVADVAELNPDFDPDGRTARVAARLVYQIAR